MCRLQSIISFHVPAIHLPNAYLMHVQPISYPTGMRAAHALGGVHRSELVCLWLGLTLGLRQPSNKIGARERARLGKQVSCRLHLIPDMP